MTNPRKEIFNNLANTWDDHLNLTKEKLSSIKNILDNCDVQASDKILDVGCGTGIMIPFLLNRIGEHGKIVGIDIADKMIDVARSKFNDERVSFIADDLLTYPFEPESFDKIIVFSAFPHFEDKKGAINVFRGLLKQGGSLTISHVDSSEDTNRFHKNLLTAILRGDNLPSINEMIEMVDETEWEVLIAKDEHKLYHLTLRKI